MIARLRASNFAKAHFWQSAGNYFGMAAALGISLVTSRIISPAEFGKYALVLSSVSLCMLPASFSLGAMLVSDGGRTPGLAVEVFDLCLPISLLKVACFTPLAAYYAVTQGSSVLLLAAVCAVPEVFKEFLTNPKAVIEGKQDFHVNALNSVISALISSVVVILLAFAGWGAMALATSTLVAWFASLILYTRFSAMAPRLGFSFLLLKKHVSSATGLWINGFSEVMSTRADKIAVGILAGDAILGFYNRALTYAPLSIMLLGSFLTNPTVALLSNAKSVANRRRVLRNTSTIVFSLSALNAIVIWFCSSWLVPIAFGPQWVDAVPYFQAFAPYCILMGIQTLGVIVFLAARQYKYLALARISSLLFLVLVLLLLTKKWGGIGAAVAVQAAMLLQAALLWNKARLYFLDSSAEFATDNIKQ